MDPLAEYLDYYCSIEKPGFAVLVTGAWGVGKTHQVKSFFKTREHCYVSLFGVNSEIDVYGAVFMEMEPAKAKTRKAAAYIKGATVGILGFSLPVGSIAAAVADRTLISKVDPMKTIILDDVERCPLPTKIMQGIVDRYLQEYGCRVVLIAHDEKLKDELLTEKEKLIGQIVRVKPDIESALSSYIDRHPKSEREFLVSVSQDIKSIFQESGVESLRILRQMIGDLVRLYRCLDEEHFSSGEFISGLIKWFLALSSQARGGFLERSDIYNRKSKLLAVEMRKITDEKKGDKAEEDKLSIAVRRFKSADLTYSPIEDDVVIEMLFDGIFEQNRVRDSLRSNPFFQSPMVCLLGAPSWNGTI